MPMMHVLGVNLLAVLAAGVATMVVGFLWYSPMLFARPWMIAMGMDPDDKEKLAAMQKSAGMSYGLAFVASLVTAFVLGKLFSRLGIVELQRAIMYSVAIWAGFVATVQLTGVLFEQKSMKLWFINTGYQLVCYVVMGIILAMWQ
ncbi:MAG TPA: DUF1761 domain-containing protein [Terriglobales bacterium]|nr:DUF1761 domain-containing protein [Terriglobales bacterium]